MNNINLADLEVNRIGKINDLGPAVLITLHLSKKQPHSEIVQILSMTEGVLYLEEL
jgi:hypothetical protein